MPNDTTRLFGLGGVEVVGVEVADDDIPILVVVTCDEQARCCPGCGARSQRPHSWARARPRDLPVAGRRTGLIWIKRRWRCLNPQCERTTFTESLPAIPPRSRLTVRLRTSVGEAVADGGRTVVQSARDHEVSWPVANAAFTTAAEAALPKDTPPVTHLGIDETRRGKAKFHLVETSDGGEAWARMHADHLDPMVADLKALPKPIGEPILAAWNCKEDLMDLLALHGTNPDRTTISRLLTAFYESAAASGLPEMERLATTVSTWWPQILAAITTGVTNAASERINRAIKTDARCAYGYRNPVNQRRRARCATTDAPEVTSPPTPAAVTLNRAHAPESRSSSKIPYGGAMAATRKFQVTFDCAEPERVARFWCEVLGYVVPSPAEDRGAWSACVDPSGEGPRLYFQRVPEGKVVKNRVHLDVRVGTGLVGEERLAALEAECARLVALGAVRLQLLPADDEDESTIVMQDIEGNEFCLD